MDGTIGEIIMFGGNFAPRNWALCQGQTIAIVQNTALFSILGTTFGGNGTTTFMLPNFSGRMPVGTGQGPGLSDYALGETGGSESATLNTSQMPAHSHILTLNCSGDMATSTTPAGNYLAVTEESLKYNSSQNAVMGSFNTGSTGSGQPLSILPPVVGMNFVICLLGLFPSRN